MKFKSFYTLAVAALVILSGCKKDFLDVNTNPNTVTSATPAYVLTNALNTTASNQVNINETGSYWSGQWTQSSSYILSTTTFAYNFTNGDFNYWDGLYDNLEDYTYVINTADANNQKFFKGPAKVMKAYVFQQLVDLYGNVPYTDALKGLAILAPKFDAQKDVYETLIKLLDEAIVDLKANAFTSAYLGTSYDIIFGGNTTNWVKFANSLKLRILMHQARISGRDAYIVPELNKIVTEGSGFITGADVAVGGASFYVASDGKQNPVYGKWGYNAAGAVIALGRFPRPTKFLVDQLVSTNDTFRLKRIAYAKGGEKASTPGISTNAELVSNYVGVPFGIGSGYTAPSTSYIGPSLIVKGQFNNPYIIMTAAEIQLNLAEAKQRFPASTLPGTAQTYYEEGIRQSFRALGAPSARVVEVINGGKADADWTASTDKLRAIAIQKWLALCNFNGLEAWTEYRKTNLPVTPQAATVADPNKRPLRLFYPATEKGSNGANVDLQGTIDPFTTRIFWDID